MRAYKESRRTQLESYATFQHLHRHCDTFLALSQISHRCLGNLREGSFTDDFDNVDMFPTDFPTSSWGMK